MFVSAIVLLSCCRAGGNNVMGFMLTVNLTVIVWRRKPSLHWTESCAPGNQQGCPETASRLSIRAGTSWAAAQGALVLLCSAGGVGGLYQEGATEWESVIRSWLRGVVSLV